MSTASSSGFGEAGNDACSLRVPTKSNLVICQKEQINKNPAQNLSAYPMGGIPGLNSRMQALLLHVQ
jgi:hypothetical protein